MLKDLFAAIVTAFIIGLPFALYFAFVMKP